MKKTLLFFAAILISVSVFAQTRATLISEHFDGLSMPAGWQVIGQTSNWSVSATQNAGGQANEMKLDWSPQFNGTTRLVTPAVDLTGVNSVVICFKHALDNYQGSNTIGIATSSDGGTTWHEGWTHNYASSGSWMVTQDITTADMGSSNVMFCIYFSGNSYNINDWYFDDIEVFTMENLDLALNSIDVFPTIGSGNTDVKVTVQNKGVTTINNIVLSYLFEGLETVEESFNVTLASLASTQLTFTTPATLLPGSYLLSVNVLAVNGEDDDDPTNNSLEKTINVALGSTQKIPMIEHFSSSTCGPCVNVNTQMHNLTTNNPGKFTYTKYQMSWPSPGDPYYTAEGGVRRTYYGVQAVPQCFLDGADQGYAAITQSALDANYNMPAFGDVRGSFSVAGNTITVKVDFMAYYDLSVEKAFVSVNEKETHNNVGNNGETTFHHIFMKFLTSPSGDALNIPAGEYQHMEFTQDMSSTHVEEMSDLEVSAWIQNMATHEVINSHFMYEYTDIHPYPVQNLAVTMDEGNLYATWEAPEGGNAQSYNVYINGELAGTTTDTEFVATTTADFSVVAVEAVYTNDMTSVKMVKTTMAEVAALTLSALELEFEEGVYEYNLEITNETENPVNITEIAENPGTNYLDIEIEGSTLLPLELLPGQSINVKIMPVVQERELVTTFINIVSDLGTQTVNVVLDPSWYDQVGEANGSYEIYPNPTTGDFTVKGTNMTGVEVYNLVGQKVYAEQGKMVHVVASEWDKGIYLVKIMNQSGSVETRKLIVK